MSDFLFQYHAIEPTTWVYLSSLLLIGLFFKFSRVFSVRNLDLFLLILLGPGLLMVYYGQSESSRIAEEAPDALEIGDTAPAFRLARAGGGELSLNEARAAGPVVLIFYRGHW